VRIAFVVHDYDRVHGHSRYVSELVERFARSHEVHVFANRFEADPPAGVTAHRVPALRASALTTIFSFLPAAALRVRGRFDIVHAQGVSAPAADVITVHISNHEWLKGRVAQNGGAGWRDRVFAGLVVPLERAAYSRPGVTLIAISQALSRALTQAYGLTGTVSVIHHGVDIRQFNPARRTHRAEVRRALGIPETATVFLFVGDARKGARETIAALSRTPGHLVIVTRSNPAEFEACARAAGVESRVSFAPPTTAIERYYGAADIFVLPTPYDAFGMVVTEAMACGLPVITTRAAGAAELVDDGVTGLLIPSASDEQSLVAAMCRLVEDQPFRVQAGVRAARSMQTHSWDTVADATMAVYEEHLTGKARRR
jgi:UDP-glucose:(heptosyl)LPS alpha-1,3-glucosyltransferase